MKFFILSILLFIGFLFGWFSHAWLFGFKDNTDKIINQLNIRSKTVAIKNSYSTNNVVASYTLYEQLLLSSEQNNWQLAEELLAKFSKDNPYEPTALNIKAEILTKQMRFLEALTVLEDLYSQVQVHYTNDYIIDKILHLVVIYLEKYKAQKHIEERIALLQRLVYLLPDEIQLVYKLGVELVKNGNFYQAKIILNTIEVNNSWQWYANKLNKILINEERFKNGTLAIPTRQKNNAWIVSVTINGGKKLNFLLDTGANITTIKEKAISKYDEVGQSRKKVLIHTVAGDVIVRKINIKKLAIHNIVDEFFAVVVVENDTLSPDIDGLLGTDWLGRFEFVIDQKQKILFLDKKDIIVP